jgi:4-oxalocrotonate tautomerase family enzyme
MPIVHITLFAGRTRVQKKNIARAVRDVLVKYGDADLARVQVIFSDVERGDWLRPDDFMEELDDVPPP